MNDCIVKHTNRQIEFKKKTMYCVFNSSSFIDLNNIDKNYMTVMSGECQVVSLQSKT